MTRLQESSGICRVNVFVVVVFDDENVENDNDDDDGDDDDDDDRHDDDNNVTVTMTANRKVKSTMSNCAAHDHNRIFIFPNNCTGVCRIDMLPFRNR